MPALIALDVALLLPPAVRETAMRVSAGLPAAESQGLRLDDEHLPHITITQQFVRVGEIDAVLQCIDEVVQRQPPIPITVAGGGKGGSAVWMAVERTQAIWTLHLQLMDALRGFEQATGTVDAFFDVDARSGDINWVAGYRLRSSANEYAPHVTLGHASEPPGIAPFTFVAATLAACHLGRFCSCRHVLQSWELIE